MTLMMIIISGFAALLRLYKESKKFESRPELDNWWYYGATGTGKTSTAFAENPGAYLKEPNKWWDDYAYQPCAIIDEWEPQHSELSSYLKRWADHYPFKAEYKGGSFDIRPSKIIVTSNFTIEECFPDPHFCAT